MYKADFMNRESEDEAYSILTSRHHEDILLQKSGHCDLVETPEGEWYAVHLCGRTAKRDMKNPPDAARFPGQRRYMLGRETAIQKMRWTEDGWLVLDCGGNTPQSEVEPPRSSKPPKPAQAEQARKPACGKSQTGLVRDDFNASELHPDYQSLRVPMDDYHISLTARPGWLRMYGRSGLASRFRQTLIARRMTEYQMKAAACIQFEPEVFKQMAGLILMYDTDNYLYLHISYDEEAGKCITLLKAENRKYEYLTGYLPLEPEKPIYLSLQTEDGKAQFYYGYEENRLQKIGPLIDAGFLSDEACTEGWFTGTMIGICCQDLTGFGKHADFDWFELGTGYF